MIDTNFKAHMNTKLVLAALATSFSLVACGGGGGSNTQTPTPIPTPTPAPTPTPTLGVNELQTTVPPSTYSAESAKLAAFTALNVARTTYGVGQVAENAKLTVAAESHAQYILGQLQAGDFNAANHTQNPAKPGYTGATLADRIAFAGFAASSAGENISSIIAVDGVAAVPGTVAVDALLSAPYHRFAFLDGSREIGFGASAIRLAGAGGVLNTVVANHAVASGAQPQLPANTWLGIWPADQATDVMYSFAGESPNPIPVNNGACAGYPVSIQVAPNFSLSVTTFTLVETATITVVSSQLSTPTTDANPTYARSNTAYLIPFKPLKTNTKYTATFVGARSGVTIDKTWTFTTTARNTKMIYGCDPS